MCAVACTFIYLGNCSVLNKIITEEEDDDEKGLTECKDVVLAGSCYFRPI